MKQYYIYLTTNQINGKQYIGQHYGELNDSYRGSGTLILKALEAYGAENFTKEILEVCESREDANNKEQFWIAFYNAVENENFYNLADGPVVGNGYKFCKKYWDEHPEEREAHIKKWNAAGLQYWKEHPEEAKKSIEKLHEASRTYWDAHPEQKQELMQKVNQAKEDWQKLHYEEHQAQVKAWREAGSKANSKKILCLTTGEVFESACEASRYYNIPQPNISKCAKGERKSAGKHPETGEKMVWMYDEE